MSHIACIEHPLTRVEAVRALWENPQRVSYTWNLLRTSVWRSIALNKHARVEKGIPNEETMVIVLRAPREDLCCARGPVGSHTQCGASEILYYHLHRRWADLKDIHATPTVRDSEHGFEQNVCQTDDSRARYSNFC